MQLIENDAEIIYEGKKLRFDTSEGVQRAEAFIRMKEVVDKETGVKVPRTKVSYCYNSLTPKAPSEPFVVHCLEARGRKKRGENIMTHVVMRFPECVCVPIAVRTQATRTVKSHRPVTPKIALEIGKKWLKQTYGNTEYMCGIHIDQPDMLLHFLIFTKDINEDGEYNARQLFLAYKLGEFLPELGATADQEVSEEDLSEESIEEQPEEMPEDGIRITGFGGIPLIQTESGETILEEKPLDEKALEPKLFAQKSFEEGLTESKPFGQKPFEEAPSEEEKSAGETPVASEPVSGRSFAGIPIETQEMLIPRDVNSVVARVRASLAEEKKQEHASAEEIRRASMRESQQLYQNKVLERRRPEQETIVVTENSNRLGAIQEEALQNDIFRQESDFVFRSQYQNAAVEMPEPEVDPLEQIKMNAANLLNQIHAQDMPSLQEEEKEQKEKTETKPEKAVAEPVKSDVNEKLKGSGDFLTKLGKTEDEMLYDESEYAKGPVGEVVWGSGASNPNVFEELPEEEKAPEVHFYIQNEKGEHEVPEEYQTELSETDIRQQSAAASYVKELKKAKWKKWGWILGAVAVIAVVVLIVILCM